MNKKSPASEIRRKWKPRKKNAHKGDFGRVCVLAGSKGLTGAAHLAAVSALRSGAGLVTLGVPEAVWPVLARREAEIMVRSFPSTKQGGFSLKALQPALNFLNTQDILALGPGLSQNGETQKWALGILKNTILPVILDADGINALQGHAEILKSCRGRAVLTPHPGEFFRAFGIKVSDRAADRVEKARKIARKFGIVLVLKGHETVVADESEVYVNSTGNPGMAKGGSGDVLTGVIAALAGQGMSLWDAARFGVYLHGLAGDMAAKKKGEAGMTAGDMIEELPPVIQKIRGI